MTSTNSGERELIDIVRQVPILLAHVHHRMDNGVPINYKAIMDMYDVIHERAKTRLKALYEKEISELQQEMRTTKDEARNQERQLRTRSDSNPWTLRPEVCRSLRL